MATHAGSEGKVFIATDDKTETRELALFATAAMQQLKSVLQ